MNSSGAIPLLNPNRIGRCCFNHFQLLPKTGKPNVTDWTVLSAILMHNSNDDQLSVIALATGTKCLPRANLDSSGFRINDSHAEVLARRGLLRFLLAEICNANESQVLTYSEANRKFRLKPHINFHFFSTHPPCGDGSIFSHTITEGTVKRAKLTVDTDNVGDILLSFTGGKVLSPDQPDPMVQHVAAIRTKPGRGERTASVSCSDKLARWNCVGLQGALLSTILEPIVYLQSLTFCGPADVAAIERAIWLRWSKATQPLPQPFVMQTPTVQLADIRFEFEKRADRQPSAGAIVWCNITERRLEVIVNGRRQGVTKKKWNTAAGRLLVSKGGLFETYMDVVLNKYPKIGLDLGIVAGISYKMAKNMAKNYNIAWQHTKNHVFKEWTTKPSNSNDFTPQ